ncbi:GNAT family N-acetyltransferase [Brucella pseudogrignonensis]|jgi:GNAT superfamily N-acetyltransferase|uniref:GNAT family N-acetyltransferase n=1 Tax=Brucella pseudogrignonensis TaxID=419475 RepID=UPI00190B03C6|nr:GNAT family N-acetyltransferase [Brucella pseudogrignonensis]MBK0022037.1 GNAT family N-acetyltransferase [Ochrobactrum sp. S45]MBK0044051.1 GNAT family N-acetyltransferase [Ochrobactrum sp. S46]UKK95082.1 GNAT family N-acetyltransferase [Brucella pseudogrignonensis]
MAIMADEFLYTSTTDIRAVPLIEALTIEYDTRYGTYFNEEGAAAEMNKYPPEAFAPPHGNFLLLLRDGQTVGGGAFMRYDDVTAEFKRIWTHSDLRRQGLAKKVLEELEAQAHRQGYKRVYLTTGFRQPEAKELYLRNGYTALFDISADPEIYGTLPFEKNIENIRQVDFNPSDTTAKQAAFG